MKRLTDTEIWKKPWFMDLTPAEKLAFYYIKDQCDNVGVWTPNFRLAEFMIGTQLDWEKFANKCNGNIYVLENGKWWLLDFCSFQHQDLVQNPDGGNSKALQSYVKLLREHGLYEFFLSYLNDDTMPIESPPNGHDNAPKVRVKEGEQVRDKSKHEITGAPINHTRYLSLCEEYGKSPVDDYIQRAVNYSYQKKGDLSQYKDYAAAAHNYMKRDKVRKKPKELTCPECNKKILSPGYCPHCGWQKEL